MSRVILSIELTPAAKETLHQFCEMRGKKKVAVLSRLVEWFALQPDEIQAIVQGDFPKSIEADAAKLILKHLAKEKR